MDKILPFRSEPLKDCILLTNEVGQYCFFDEDTTRQELISKGFLCREEDIQGVLEEWGIKLRTKKAFLDSFTSLHIVVLTNTCNGSCSYCQASSTSQNDTHMNRTVAKAVVGTIMKSPAKALKIEFQGGEPTLNSEILSFIVEYSKVLNRRAKKYLEYVVCTNLLSLSDEQLSYYRKHNIQISTSLDGPRALHDRFRGDTYDRVIANLKRTHASALMTVTEESLPHLRLCVDTYVELELSSIFLRPINPYGLAEEKEYFQSYSVEEYLIAYEDALRYILALNLRGTFIREEYACVFLRKILTPFSNGFVDIQSPTGNGIGCAVYTSEGNVYVSDEARMLARMRDETFRLGNVLVNRYDEVFGSEQLRSLVQESIIEADRHCHGCVFIPYCGKDMVRIYQEKKLGIEHTSCKRNRGILTILFKLIRENPHFEQVFWSWITERSVKELRV